VSLPSLCPISFLSRGIVQKVSAVADEPRKQTEHVQFVSTLSKGRNFVRHCRQKTSTLLHNVEATFDTVERTKFYDKRSTLLPFVATKSNVGSTKSNVASTMLLVWTGLQLNNICDGPRAAKRHFQRVVNRGGPSL